MERLLTALSSIELTIEKNAAYWDALCDLPIEAVEYACQHAARHFQPTPYERVPVPGTLREYVRQWRYEQAQQAGTQVRKDAVGLLPARTEATEAEGLAYIHDILAKLERTMSFPGAEANAEMPDELAARRRARALRRGPRPQEEGA